MCTINLSVINNKISLFELFIFYCRYYYKLFNINDNFMFILNNKISLCVLFLLLLVVIIRL